MATQQIGMTLCDASATEQTELDEFLRLNRFMSRLKLKARQKLAS